MTKAEIKIMGNKSMTEDSQYLKCGGDDRTEKLNTHGLFIFL